MGISDSDLKTWIRAARENGGSVSTRKSGNYSNDDSLLSLVLSTRRTRNIVKETTYGEQTLLSVETVAAKDCSQIIFINTALVCQCMPACFTVYFHDGKRKDTVSKLDVPFVSAMTDQKRSQDKTI